MTRAKLAAMDLLIESMGDGKWKLAMGTVDPSGVPINDCRVVFNEESRCDVAWLPGTSMEQLNHAAFITRAREYIPKLVAEVRRLHRQLGEP